MNLNDAQTYRLIAYKTKIVYAHATSILLRDALLHFTKDGSHPNLGTKEVLLVTEATYQQIMSERNFKRDHVRSLAAHSWSYDYGYRALNAMGV
jgi:hypothetical protein